MKLSESQKTYLMDTTAEYSRMLPGSPGEEYLAARGIPLDVANQFGLGYVAEPLGGHANYEGMISVPYLRPGSKGTHVVSMRFRCIRPGCEHTDYHGKMNSLPGDSPRLFNTASCLTSNETIAICEGEFDAVTAQMCGIDAVGVQGTQGWKSRWAEIFRGYEKVFILADNDDAGQGMKFAKQVAETLPNARITPAPKGHDINSAYMALGREAVLERIK